MHEMTLSQTIVICSQDVVVFGPGGVAQEPAVENVGHSASDGRNTVWPDLNML